ncbi:MAG: carboxypeptidase regulatory-like domain-containing protein [Pyrinomonadaceae bacterium]|nr:carboxypeptidase regulatory-like domain-containing protein [Pyrinomonadaceae bacterium]
MKKLCTMFALLLVAMLFVSIDIAAQDFRATVVGRITDQAGAAVPGAQVAITNTETNQLTRIVSNEEGEYVITALQPGTYRLEIEQRGFKRFVQAFTEGLSEDSSLVARVKYNGGGL